MPQSHCAMPSGRTLTQGAEAVLTNFPMHRIQSKASGSAVRTFSSAPSGRVMPIDRSTHIPEELFQGLLLAAHEVKRGGQHKLAEDSPARRQHLVIAGAQLARRG